jgi:hypothetical protein
MLTLSGGVAFCAHQYVRRKVTQPWRKTSIKYSIDKPWRKTNRPLLIESKQSEKAPTLEYSVLLACDAKAPPLRRNSKFRQGDVRSVISENTRGLIRPWRHDQRFNLCQMTVNKLRAHWWKIVTYCMVLEHSYRRVGSRVPCRAVRSWWTLAWR